MQHPQLQNIQCSWSQTFHVPDRYSDQLRLCREWEGKMEKLNDKYGVNCFSNSELTPNQMKEKNTDMNTSMKHSFKLLKSIDVGVKDVKIQYIYFIFFHLILPGFA